METPSSKDSAPANTRAVISPRLKPADPTQLYTAFGLSSLSTSRLANEVVIIATWLYRISFSLILGPPLHSFSRLYLKH